MKFWHLRPINGGKRVESELFFAEGKYKTEKTKGLVKVNPTAFS